MNSNQAYADQVLIDTERLSIAYQTSSDAPVAACPGWTMDRLVSHVGVVHRWATHCATHAAPPEDRSAFRMSENADSRQWLLDGATQLAETLRALDPLAPTWHPFPAPQVAGLWPRRMAHETAIHRWDAQAAVGAPSPIEPWLATDGIDEYFEVMVPRQAVERELPAESLHVHCTDIEGEWLVEVVDGEYRLVREHRKGAAALRGPADQILLALWGRDRIGADLEPVGDDGVLNDWLALGGP